MTTMRNLPEVVSREQWLAARKDLLVKEKEVTRTRVPRCASPTSTNT
jgi:predicted dithiol-disulfide oxidoreductase (DUF899 family)